MEKRRPILVITVMMALRQLNIYTIRRYVTLPSQSPLAELQKRANRANQLVLFFLASANFWEKHVKNRRKHAKTGENTQKQAKNRRFFGANVFWGKIGRC